MCKVRFLIVFIACILLTGCGAKSLVCTKSTKNDIGNSKSKVTMYFTKNNISAAEIETTMTLSYAYRSYIDVVASQLKDKFKSYDNKKGIGFDINTLDNEVKTSIKFNLSEMSDSDKKNMDFDTSSSINEVKSFYKKNGYTCR